LLVLFNFAHYMGSNRVQCTKMTLERSPSAHTGPGF
jgi:hypothetical protein